MKFKATHDWNTYLPLLGEALKQTKGTVIEYGMGDSSTPILHDYCAKYNRKLRSYDSSLDWYSKFSHLSNVDHSVTYITNWDNAFDPDADVVLIDHAPGERRQVDIEKYAGTNAILVVHDTQPSADHGYNMRRLFSLFKTVKEFKSEGSWATLLTNRK